MDLLKSAIIISAADKNYFPLLEGLVRSLKTGPIASRLPLGILDLGLEPAQQDWLRSQGATLVAPDWDIDFPGRDKAPGHYRAMTARPYLPRHFPGYALYQWIDADAWVQDDSILEWFLRAAARGQLAIVPELDRGYWTMYKPPKLWAQNHKAFAWGFGLKAGYRLGRNPILNSGVFALAGDAPHWALWAKAHRTMLTRRRRHPPFGGDPMLFFIAEQTALNYVVFADKQPFTLLPATCNWFCGKGTPLWDEATGRLVEPHEPHTPLAVIHLAGKGMKERVWSLSTLQGGTVTLRLVQEEVEATRRQARPAAPAKGGADAPA